MTTGFLPVIPEKKTRSHKYTIFKRNCKLDIRKYSFSYRIVEQWNNLPKYVVHVQKVFTFEKRLDKMWSDLDPNVLYSPDIDMKKVTSAYNTRYYEPSEHTNCTNTTGTDHAQRITDLSPEVPLGTYLSEVDHCKSL